MKNKIKRLFSILIILCMAFSMSTAFAGDVFAKTDELKTVSVAYFYNDDYFNGIYDTGVKEGFGYEYLQTIANYSGWRYKYVYGDYNFLLDQFMQGKIDVMPMVSRDFDTEAYYEKLFENAVNEEARIEMKNNTIKLLYPNQPMSAEEYYICYPSAEAETFNEAKLSIARIAVPAEVADYAENWIDNLKLTSRIAVYDGMPGCINAVNKGEADVIIATDDAVDEDYVLYKKLGSIEYYLAISSNNKSLLEDVNNALENLNESINGIENVTQYAKVYKTPVTNNLSYKEKSYIDYHKILKVGTLLDDMPYSDYDSENEQNMGFTPELFNELIDNLELDNVVIDYEYFNSYPEMMDALQNDQIDMAFPVPTYLYQSEQNDFMTTKSVAEIMMSMVYKGNYSESLLSEIAIPQDKLVPSYADYNNATAQFVTYSNVIGALDGVKGDEAQCAVIYSINAEKYIRDGNKYDMLNYVALSEKLPVGVAVKRGNIPLYILLNRAITITSNDEMDQLLTRTIAEVEEASRATLGRVFNKQFIITIIVIFVLVAIIAVLVFINRNTREASKKLRKANNEIRGIAEHQQQNFDVIGILAREYSSVYKVYMATETCEIYRQEDSIDTKYGDLLRKGSKFSDIFNQYVRDYVFEDDKPKMYDELSLDVIKKKLAVNNTYAVRYRRHTEGSNESRYFEMRISAAEKDMDNSVTTFIIAFIDCNNEIVHELQYMKSLEKALKSDAVITGLTGDFDWVAYVPNADNDSVTTYRAGDVVKSQFSDWETQYNYADMMREIAETLVIDEDRKHFRKETEKAHIVKKLSKDSSFVVNFRILLNEEPEYYQFKFVADVVDGKLYGIIVGFHSVDDELRKEKEQQEKLEQMVFLRTAELEEKNNSLNRMNNDIVELMGNVVEGRDTESGEHVKRVKAYTNILATQVMKDLPEYELTPETVELMTSASALHDVGKITIPDSILLKPGRLTPEEFDIMKTHTVNGCVILDKMPGDWNKDYLKMSMDICRHHHEKYDGKGYPDGLVGDDIPISAQIVAVADCFDALVSKRVYKDAFTSDKAFDMILNGECGVFSPKLMSCFAKCKEGFCAQLKVSYNE